MLDPKTMQPVPWDGETIGEVMFRGNIDDEGLPEEREGDTRGVPRRLVPLGRSRGGASGWLSAHQGPQQGHHHLGRREHLVDRSRGRAVPASRPSLPRRSSPQPDAKWGEVPCAFVELKDGVELTRSRTAGTLPHSTSRASRCPRRVVFGALPKTSTGQDPEVHAAAAGEVRLCDRCLRSDHERTRSAAVTEPLRAERTRRSRRRHADAEPAAAVQRAVRRNDDRAAGGTRRASPRDDSGTRRRDRGARQGASARATISSR